MAILSRFQDFFYRLNVGNNPRRQPACKNSPTLFCVGLIYWLDEVMSFPALVLRLFAYSMRGKAAQAKQQRKCKYNDVDVKSLAPVFFPSGQTADSPEIVEDDLKHGNDTPRSRHTVKCREKFIKSVCLHLTINKRNSDLVGISSSKSTFLPLFILSVYKIVQNY